MSETSQTAKQISQRADLSGAKILVLKPIFKHQLAEDLNARRAKVISKMNKADKKNADKVAKNMGLVNDSN
ncbi:MAG: hypothetical protein HRU29_01620 [Rhizobiales bacterium]|nr:hypothetical protein [Hyphomicrobiales bacterium]NRB13073.1 hypothetical protein [Hyphomicrobiales bacterium]